MFYFTASGVNYLFQVQSKTFTDVFSGTDVIVKASKCTVIHYGERGGGGSVEEGMEEGRIAEDEGRGGGRGGGGGTENGGGGGGVE